MSLLDLVRLHLTGLPQDGGAGGGGAARQHLQLSSPEQHLPFLAVGLPPHLQGQSE